MDGGASLENTTVSGDGDGSAVSAPADGEVAGREVGKLAPSVAAAAAVCV